MLSKKEKQRIRSEEEFRGSLRSAAPDSNGLWLFLNSAFGIWFLSTLMLGGLGWIYTRWEAFQDNAKQVKRLDVEINARLSSTEDYMTAHLYAPDRMSNAVDLLLLPPANENAIQQEFANRNFKSLLHELNERIGEDDKEVIGTALLKVYELQNAVANAEQKDSSDRVTEMFRLRRTLQELRRLRWLSEDKLQDDILR